MSPRLRALAAAVLTWVGLSLSLSLVTREEEKLPQVFPAWDLAKVPSPQCRMPCKLVDEPCWAFYGPYDSKPDF